MVVWCVNYVILQHYILHLYLIFFANMERIYYLCKVKHVWMGVCRKFANYLTSNFLLYISLHNPTIFITFAIQKENNNLNINPL